MHLKQVSDLIRFSNIRMTREKKNLLDLIKTYFPSLKYNIQKSYDLLAI